jgi:hypothetical protein
MIVRFTRRAEQDLVDILDYLAGHSPQGASTERRLTSSISGMRRDVLGLHNIGIFSAFVRPKAAIAPPGAQR